MSDRLALSAAVSVMMVAIYVLFGNDAAHLPLSPSHLAGPLGVSGPELSVSPGPFAALR